MATLDFPEFQKHLSRFDFGRLFVEVLGWNRAAANRDWQNDEAGQMEFRYRAVAELAGVVVLQIVADEHWPDETQRLAIWRKLSAQHYENLLIFTDQAELATQSLWYWVKRSKDAETGKPKLTPRRHEYFRGQPVDLFASKLQAMVFELSELDGDGRVPVLEVARRMESALDVEKTTKRFYKSYQEQHDKLLQAIQGIDDERDRRWYASVVLNRLMFVWFLQKKGFLNRADYDYLSHQLAASQQRGKDRFFGEFLSALFFEAFAKPADDRSQTVRQLTGEVPYLNGGLFLHHKLELDDNAQPRLGRTLLIADDAFEGVFNLFASYTWHLDDTPGGDSDEINPDVLGYIFEKYINQKAFGAYYTRPEITSYLADRSIHALILERINVPAVPELGLPAIDFASVPDMLAKMDARTALKLVGEVLPSISVLDPAVGSGAFLVAALKSMINIYYAVVGRAKLNASDDLARWLQAIEREHPSVEYYIKRRIVTDNLYGVDIMEEATEIAKLRLFLAMVSSVRKVEHLEPLPNIDFNILPGNSLVGFTRVDEHEFDQKNRTGDLFKPAYRKLVDDKNRKLDTYRHTASLLGKEVDLRVLRDDIDSEMQIATGILSELLRDTFESLGVKYEQATWDANKHQLGKPKKRKIARTDIDAQHPFHWGYVFDDVMQRRGGFDIILTNPPWEVFKPQAKEFFAEHSELVSRNKMTIKEFEKEQGKLLKIKAVRDAWLEYESRFPHVSGYFRAAPEYCFQTAKVDGRKTGSDLNLYKLFVERCFNLLRGGGHCGIVIPSGIYTDLGATGLRSLLFQHTSIQGLFGFENRKEIFEGVHRSFKFVVLTFEKSDVPHLQQPGECNASAPPDGLLAPTRTGANGTQSFPAAFMRLDVSELDRFPADGALWLDVKLIKRLSPGSHSLMEFNSELDIRIAEKLLKHPLLGERIDGVWNLSLGNEFHMTNDSGLFKTATGPRRLPLYEGKMISQFNSTAQAPKYWVEESVGRAALLGRSLDEGQRLPYQRSRFAHRAIARGTDSRTMIGTILPRNCFSTHSLNVAFEPLGERAQLLLLSFLNSFCFDYYLRQKVSANLTQFFIYQCPVPRLQVDETMSDRLQQRAAQLICTRPEFDELAREAGLRGHLDGATDPLERARLRAELDGLVAHLYGLTDAEFLHILGTFPLVPESVRVDAYNAYRRVAQGLIV